MYRPRYSGLPELYARTLTWFAHSPCGRFSANQPWKKKTNGKLIIQQSNTNEQKQQGLLTCYIDQEILTFGSCARKLWHGSLTLIKGIGALTNHGKTTIGKWMIQQSNPNAQKTTRISYLMYWPRYSGLPELYARTLTWFAHSPCGRLSAHQPWKKHWMVSQSFNNQTRTHKNNKDFLPAT